MRKILLTILIAAVLVGAAIYDIRAAFILAAIILITIALPWVIATFFPFLEKWEARSRAKRIKKIRELEQERRTNIERIIREVPQEHFSE